MHGIALFVMAVAGLLPVLPASAAPRESVAREVWPGRRVVLLLPLQLSDNWNADPAWGQTLLRSAEFHLRRALEDTGKFSVVQPYRFDPILQRALQEKRGGIAKDQVDELIDKPSLQSASGVLANLGFELTPLIADFRLEEVRASGSAKAPAVQVQVLGKLYDLNSQEANQTKVFTSDPIRTQGSQFDTVILAAANAFKMVSREFVKPPADVALPRVEPLPAELDPKAKAAAAKATAAKAKADKAKADKEKAAKEKADKAKAAGGTGQPGTPPAPGTATPTTPPSPGATAAKPGEVATPGLEGNDIYINPLNRGQLTRNP